MGCRDGYYVVVQMTGNDLNASLFKSYEKAYIIRIEDYCADAYDPITITLEPHT